ncbi:hypothetical protein K501DRAFT_248475 [Backusella circina FSU 941]|nr:hypothetical protein K501DRAFT_248475 [Backusella circina FSU 941]
MSKRIEDKKAKAEQDQEREAKKSKTKDSGDGGEVIAQVVIKPMPFRKPVQITRKLNLPRRKKKEPLNSQNTEENMEKLSESLKAAENDVPEEDKFECPSCFEVLKRPYPSAVENQIRKFHNQEQRHRNEQIKQHDAELKLSKKRKQDGSIEKPLLLKKLEIPELSAKEFCHLHKLEMRMKPLGVKKSYPIVIRFDKLPGRVQKMEKDLLDVIEGKTECSFFNDIKEVFKEEGSNKARSTFSLMSRIDKALPGYYGPRGSAVLVETLGKLFMETNILKREHTKPLQPVEYLQQVLVPESAVRLIQEDLKKKKLPSSREIAVNTMKESIEFGTVVHSEKQE